MNPCYRVAVVGAGIAERHLAAYQQLRGRFEVAVLCSLDEPRGQGLCSKYAIPGFTRDFDALLARRDIDIIDICTPPTNHFELCAQALRAGKQVICEKPLFGSLSEVDRMSTIAAQTGGRLMPIFQYRYGAGLQKLKALMAAGLTGRPYMTTIETHWWRGPAYYQVAWRGKWATELGGGLLGHAIHAHDMLTYLHGPVAELFAYGGPLLNDIEVEDHMALALKMRNGSLASLSLSLASREETSRLRFCFHDLTAQSHNAPYTMSQDPWTFVAGSTEHQARVDALLAGFVPTADGYTRQFELFHDALVRGDEPPVTLADARTSLELVTAAYHAQRNGMPVRLPITPSHVLYRSWAPPPASAAPAKTQAVPETRS